MQIHNYIKTSLIDYPGKISCVVFTQGCMWRCWYCQNAELLVKKQGQILEEEVLEFLKTRKGLLDAVVICGGEPTLQADLKDFIKKVKTLGFLVKLDTNGTNPEVLKELLDENLLDYVAMDIKAPLYKYKDIAMVDIETKKLELSIEILKHSTIDYEFRTTVVPTLSKQDIVDIAKTIEGAPHYYLQHFVKQKSCNKDFVLYDDKMLGEFVRISNNYIETKLR